MISDDSIKAVFDLGSGSKLNLSKSKGLWLGGWNGRLDPPITLEWTSGMIKVLGVFIGIGDLEEANWHPRVTAVKNTLNSWCHLSYHGRALVINALNLFFLGGFLWYQLSLKFGHSMCNGPGALLLVRLRGSIFCTFIFGVVLVRLLWMFSLALLTLLLVLYLLSIVHFSLLGVQLMGGFLLVMVLLRLVALWVCLYLLFPLFPRSRSTTFCCLRNLSTPQCVVNFASIFGLLYWSCTWRQLFLFDVDRPVIDVAWKIAHGVLYTADHLASFGYSLQLSCFCNSAPESIDNLFFECPLAQSVLSWLQSLMFRWSLLAPSPAVRHICFGFSADELSYVPKVFVYILNVCKFFLWLARNDYRFRNVRPSAVDVLANVRIRIRFQLSIFFKRFRSPHRHRLFGPLWGAYNVVASFVNDHLLVHV